MEIDEYDSILCLIDELKAEDHNTRLHAINSLNIIAEAIGEEKTRSELIPYTKELLEDENEEVLLALSSKLGELSNYIGDSAHLICLITPLITLCSNEDSIVQQSAINSVELILEKIPVKEIEEIYLPILQSLFSSTWFSARVAACSLIHKALNFATNGKQESLLEAFLKLGDDENPVVRKEIASKIGNIAAFDDCERLIQILFKLINDENDSVRQMALKSIVKIVKDEKVLIDVVKKYAVDKSWRVRYALLENIEDLLTNFESISPLKEEIIALINDLEPEVRYISLTKLSQLSKKIPKNVLEQEIIPCFDSLYKDPSQHVRLSLMRSICEISSQIDTKISIQRLLPIINHLIRDESFEVRMSFAENMNLFNLAIGPEKVLTFSIPLIMQMMNDGQWRLRLKVVESLPEMCDLLGMVSFTEQISAPMMKWVEDPVYAVREMALDSLKQIGVKFGSDWTKSHILPLIEMLALTPVFSKRMTSIRAINKIGFLFDYQICSRLLALLSRDSVPNIRLNVAKSIKNLSEFFVLEENLLKILEKMKFDSDTDVKFYACDALRYFTKINNL